MDFALANKVALVTGGARGLGREICLRLAREGAAVAVNYRESREKAAELVRHIKETYHVEAISVKGDIANQEDVGQMFVQVTSQLSGIDILINNAGVCPVSMVKDMSLKEWERVIGTNLTGIFLTCREMVNTLLKLSRPGAIVNIASQTAFSGSSSGKSHYSASKGGVVSFTVSLAKEIARYGIRVNAVSPGIMDTDMTAENLAENLEKYKRDIPLGRVAELREVANVAVFLASEAAGYMTGATVDISGGISHR